MGSAAEQDPHFLSAFRSLLLSEQDEIDANIIQVHDGGQGVGRHPVHFLLLLNGFPDHTNNAVKAASDTIETKVWPHGPALVRLYFKHIHPVYPIVSKVRFLRRYADNRLELPASLRGAVYALACVFWNQDPQLTDPCPFQQYELVAEAHSALRRELEAPNLFKLQACLLLLHITPPDIDSVETPTTWFMASQATACAQMIGLHQDPGPWNIAPWEKKLRKRLWWAVFATDCWSAVCHGNPPHIGPSTFDTTPLTVDDLRFDEDVPEDLHYLVNPEDRQFRVANSVRCLEAVNLAQNLRTILDCSYLVKPTMVEPQAQCCLQTAYDRLQEWPSLVPHCLTVGSGRENPHNGPLNLSYFAVQVLLFRALMSPATREAKANPDSNLSKWFSTALESFKSFACFMDEITEEDLTGFWGRHARSQLILCGNFLIYLFLLASKPQDIEAAYRLLEKFHQSLQRLGGTEDLSARLLLRPVILRIDSFFLQATELIKKGRQDIVAESPSVV
ncbi:unnamed protein product [Clonostachys byssicola]|uniref:Xylanolytic transcriptional activator regulatory domain-containing protein n=1 Tax=Clonostachys byssicola TaxID=160290 RepID=A0A9N9YBR6_9HYPO|nr:unnamed protein product [Clonostachys byssicola]